MGLCETTAPWPLYNALRWHPSGYDHTHPSPEDATLFLDAKAELPRTMGSLSPVPSGYTWGTSLGTAPQACDLLFYPSRDLLYPMYPLFSKTSYVERGGGV